MAKWGEVTRISEMSRLTAEGEVVKFYRHSVRTAKGASITVDIDEENFTAEKAEPILKAKAEAADKILSL